MTASTSEFTNLNQREQTLLKIFESVTRDINIHSYNQAAQYPIISAHCNRMGTQCHSEQRALTYPNPVAQETEE